MAELPAALEVPDEAELEEPGAFEEPDVLEEPDEPELLEESEEVFTGVRRDLADERCLRERPPEADPPAEILSGETPAVEGTASWAPCSWGWKPGPCGKRRECEAPPCGERPPCDGSPCGECVSPDAVTCGEDWVPAGAPCGEGWLSGEPWPWGEGAGASLGADRPCEGLPVGAGWRGGGAFSVGEALLTGGGRPAGADLPGGAGSEAG